MCLLGRQQNKVGSSFAGGFLSLFTFNYQMRRLVRHCRYKLDQTGEREELFISLAASDHGDHLLVAISDDHMNCTRMMVFCERSNNLVQKAVFELLEECPPNYCISFCEWVSDHLLWIGAEYGSQPSLRAKVYDYNLKSEQFRELEEKRVPHRADYLLEMVRMRDMFYYASRDGKVFRLKVTFLIIYSSF